MTYENEVCRSKSGMNLNPFGMLMPDRNFAGSDKYRFGFNGKEKDDEITNQNGSHLDFGARIYDARIGRWLAMDPSSSKYSWSSPYVFTNNNPICIIDPDGKDGVGVHTISKSGVSTITITAVYYVEQECVEQMAVLMKINKTLNAQNYIVTDPNSEYYGSVVKFDLTIVSAGKNENTALYYAENESEKKTVYSSDFKELSTTQNGIPIANSIIFKSQDEWQNDPDAKSIANAYKVKPDNVGGLAGKDQHIKMPEVHSLNIKSTIHEIFHTLFFNRDPQGQTERDNGIKNNSNGQELPQEYEINELINGLENKGKIIDGE